MKRLSILAAATLLVTSIPTFAASQSAPPAESRELQEFCYALLASGEFPALNLGECMSFNSTSEHGFKAHFCDLLRETDGYGDFGFKSYSVCIHNLPF